MGSTPRGGGVNGLGRMTHRVTLSVTERKPPASQTVGAIPFLLGAVGCAAAASLCLMLTTRLLGEERIIFGRA